MIIKSVSYKRVFPIGSFQTEAIGFEAEITEHLGSGSDGGTVRHAVIETPQFVIEKLRQLAEDCHKEKYPHYYQDNGHAQPKVNQPSQEEKTIEQMIEDMKGCRTVDELKSYRFLPAQNPKFKEAYDEMYKKLSA